MESYEMRSSASKLLANVAADSCAALSNLRTRDGTRKQSQICAALALGVIRFKTADNLVGEDPKRSGSQPATFLSCAHIRLCIFENRGDFVFLPQDGASIKILITKGLAEPQVDHSPASESFESRHASQDGLSRQGFEQADSAPKRCLTTTPSTFAQLSLCHSVINSLRQVRTAKGAAQNRPW